MADIKRTVELEFIASTDKAQKGLQDMVKNADKIQIKGLRQQKKSAGISQKSRREEKAHRKGKTPEQSEKLLLQETKRTTAELRRRLSVNRELLRSNDQLLKKMKQLSAEAQKINAGGVKGRAGGGRGGVGGGKGRAGGGKGRAGGGKGRAGRAGGGSFFGAAARGVGGALAGAALAAGGFLYGTATGQMSEGYAARVAYGTAYGRLAGAGGSRRDLNRQRNFAESMGFGPVAMAGQAYPLARATGVVGGSSLRTSMALQRSTAMSNSETTGFMGMMTQAGQGFGGKAGSAGKNELVKTLALGMYSGLDRARMPEFFAATAQLVQRQMGATAGTVDTNVAARLLAMLGASKKPGLQGARGGSVAAALDRGIRAPGGGEAGESIILRAFGFGKPGGTTSLYDARKRMQKGIFEPGNLKAVFSQFGREYGAGGQSQIMAMEKVFNLTYTQLEDLRDIMNGPGTAAEKKRKIQGVRNGTLEEQARKGMSTFGDVTKHTAQLQNRSFKIGDRLKKSIETLQHVVNRFVDDVMPTLSKALEKVANAVVAVDHFVREQLGDRFDGGDIGKLKKKTKKLIATGSAKTVLTEVQRLEDRNIKLAADRAAESFSTYMADWMLQVARGTVLNIDAATGHGTGKSFSDMFDMTQEGSSRLESQVNSQAQRRLMVAQAMNLRQKTSSRVQELEAGGVTDTERVQIASLVEALGRFNEAGQSGERQEIINQGLALERVLTATMGSRGPTEIRHTANPTIDGTGRTP